MFHSNSNNLVSFKYNKVIPLQNILMNSYYCQSVDCNEFGARDKLQELLLLSSL